MVLLGLGTRIAASLLFINMVVAGITVHLSKGFFLQNGGFEYTFILGCLCLALVFLGTGKFGINKNF
jgi:putative oxidoreductase